MNSTQPSRVNSVNRVNIQILLKQLEPLLLEVTGNTTGEVLEVQPPGQSGPESVVFIKEENALKEAQKSPLRVLIVTSTLKEKTLNDFAGQLSQIAILETINFDRSFATVLKNFEKTHFVKEGIHESSVVHPSAKVAASAKIGPFCVIGADVTIGENSILESHVILEDRSALGKNSKISSFVALGHDCSIGDNCIVHFGCAIGSDGFGFYKSPQGAQKIPQIGNVIIGNSVELGAHCAIDRATMTSTRIGHRVKIDNHVHIGHNTQIGDDSIIAGAVSFAGSCEVGQRFLCGGGTLISGHVKIVDDVSVGGRSAVTNDILEKGGYGGYPLQPVKTYLKNTVLLGQLEQLQTRIRKLEAFIEAQNLSNNQESK